MTDDSESVSALLDRLGVTEIDVVGIATDYCVRASALDALAATGPEGDPRHVRVIKSSDAGAAAGAGFTASDVVLLDEAERVRELARMLAGQEDSSTAQAHAEELLGDAQQMVSSLS